MHVIFTVGVSGSGKSAWAKSQLLDLLHERGRILCRDDARIQFSETIIKRPFKWHEWNWKNEDKITEMIDSTFSQLENGSLDQVDTVIFADTNLNKQRLHSKIAGLKARGHTCEIRSFLDVPLQTCIERDLQRPNPVGRDVIEKQWLQALNNYPERIGRYIPDKSLPSAILVDIDGTLAHRGNRGPFDWSKVGEDTPDLIVCEIVRGLSKNHEIVFMSGRDEICRSETLEWLKNNVVSAGQAIFGNIPLFMRSVGDTRKDSIIKQELFERFVAPHYNVVAVIDDRKQVLEMWTNLGIKTIDVGNIYERF